MYELILSGKAKRQLSKLEKNVQDRIGRVFERVKIRPESHFKRLVNSNYFSLRVGNYRIIADIIKGRLVILVIDIGHRKNIYKN
jgi:mRNA interferase RelE/StbE